jgi:hypothetical protein
MKTPKNAAVIRIVQPLGQEVLSDGQKQFNKLIKKIEGQRKKLSALQVEILAYEQQFNNECLPLLDKFQQHRVELLHLFDDAFDNKKLSAREKGNLSDYIYNLGSELLNGGVKDESIERIVNKHCDPDDEADEAGEALEKSILKDMFGLDIDEGDSMSAEEAFMKFIAEQMEKGKQQAEKFQEAEELRQSTRKKTAQEIKKECEQQAHEQQISQSIREVFRKLASALHPDKEQDPNERERKNALMQRVNVAYGKNDLLQLLELQLEVEQIDQTAMNAISEDRLKYYNQILNTQSAELQMEISAVWQRFKAQHHIRARTALSPAKIKSLAQENVLSFERSINILCEDISNFKDLKTLKKFLKSTPTGTSFLEHVYGYDDEYVQNRAYDADDWF